MSPFTCPECSREGSRDRITLARHYAFAHNKLFEMTDVTPEMLIPSNTAMNHNMELKKSGQKQSDEDVSNQNNQSQDHVKVKKEKEDLKLEEKEELKVKESVAALSVKSDSNFVEWQKSFGKHESSQSSSGKKRKTREAETKEERRERKEKRRMERREAERREAQRWEAEERQIGVKSEYKEDVKGEVKSESRVKSEKSEVFAAKPLFSLMMQELDNSSSRSGTSVRAIKGEEAERKVKDYEYFVFSLEIFIKGGH